MVILKNFRTKCETFSTQCKETLFLYYCSQVMTLKSVLAAHSTTELFVLPKLCAVVVLQMRRSQERARPLAGTMTAACIWPSIDAAAFLTHIQDTRSARPPQSCIDVCAKSIKMISGVHTPFGSSILWCLLKEYRRHTVQWASRAHVICQANLLQSYIDFFSPFLFGLLSLWSLQHKNLLNHTVC